MQQRRILVGVTGGISAYKVPELVRTLGRSGHDVRCAMTPRAARFVSPLVLQTLTGSPVRSTPLPISWQSPITVSSALHIHAQSSSPMIRAGSNLIT